MKRLLPFLIISLILSLSSCYYSNSFQNRESDKQDAEKVSAEFFGYIQQSDFEKASTLFSEDFYKVVSKEELMQLFESSNNKLGKLKSTELAGWNTTVSEGSVNQSVYNLNYNADFENDTAVLNLIFTKNDNEQIKLIRYNIQSNAFLN